MGTLLGNPLFRRFLELLTGSRVLRLQKEMHEDNLTDEERVERRAIWADELAKSRLVHAACLFSLVGLLKLVMRR